MGVLPVTEKKVFLNRLEEIRKRALDDPEGFWDEHGRVLEWFKQWDKVIEDKDKPSYRWFVGGKINASYNAVDRHVKTWRKNKVAIIW